MSTIRKTYTGEFKQEALRLLETSGKSAAQIERDLSWPRLSFPLEIQVLSGQQLGLSRARSGHAGAGAAPAIGV